MKYNIDAPSYPLAFVITVSSNGLWSDDTKSLPEPNADQLSTENLGTKFN